MWRSFALGVVTGMRSQLPAALLAWRASRGDLPEPMEGPASLLRRPASLPIAALTAAGELVGDKLPMTPSRLETGPFVGRLTLGATAGSGVAAAFGGSRLAGAVLGAAGAAVGSVAGYRLRAYAVARTDTPDAVWAIIEDGIGIALGLAATRAETG